tara:strand:- start:54 stop:314 length:261 start_codon:yes stop_codon:yes gene_type:complete
MAAVTAHLKMAIDQNRRIDMSRWRHLTVAIGLIPALTIYIGLVMQIADMVTNIHLVLDFAFYLVAGLAWIPVASKVVGWLAKHESH